ncbi:MAG: DEAD/DEAH box helicase [Sarcina sp.]
MYEQIGLDLTNLDNIKKEISRNKLENSKLITNSNGNNMLLELKAAFKNCVGFYFSVAFINFSGLQLILDNLKEMKSKGVKGKIITSTYLNFTQPKALEYIKKFDNIDSKIFITDEKLRGFHTKVYIFEYEECFKIFIGSSNMTQSALKNNEEWNVKIVSKKDDEFSKTVMNAYNNLFYESEKVDETFISEYKSFIDEINSDITKKSLKFISSKRKINPNFMQKRAIESLKRLREHGENKSLVIAATGTGKTYMSAFDVREYKAKRMLFIVHREDILRKAINDYKKIIIDKTFGLFTGNIKEKNVDYLFATIQTISKYYEIFNEDEFDYIIIDEAHHAISPTYKAVLEYFKPKFLLGMTATPERTNGEDIFDIFDSNIALEIRISEALEQNLVAPFHYFGITDIESIDYSKININDIDKVAKILQINERVDFIIEKMNFYGFDGDKRKCIGFCANIEHARYMEEEFCMRGIHSKALVGSDSIDTRKKYITKLEDDKDNLEVIFTVDLFNEGVDIPSINSILMLRPTQSPIIFIQQLGRGLRRYENKDFLTVLDFIGNYNKAFLIAIALNGGKFYDKQSLKISLKNDFINIKGCTNIQMDEIAKERILEQIDRENFNSLKYLKEEYFEFKKINNGKVVNLLTDYFKYEAAINPIKFIKASVSKTYLGFLEKVENNFEDISLLKNKLFKDGLKDITGKLPLKRPFEFIIIKYLVQNNIASKEILKNEVEKSISYVDEETFEYTLECLKGEYYSKKESNYNFINIIDNEITLTDEFKEIIKIDKCKLYINDVLSYGLLMYEREFGKKNYGVPFLKLYSQYTRDDVVRISNAKMKFGGYGMGGLKTNGNEWFMFVNLEKELDIKESINHENEFIGDDIFVWQSRNTTTIDSKAGQELINNIKENINMHLFVRKYKEIDGVIEPYIYIGKGDTIYHEGEKPITVHLKLRNKVPIDLLNEFNK